MSEQPIPPLAPDAPVILEMSHISKSFGAVTALVDVSVRLRRGEVLAGFKAAYRESGFLVNTAGELPDYLPMVLEFAAVADPEAGEALLREYRPSLELLRIGLAEDGTPYADVVAAVCATLPGASPKDRAAVQALVGGPPTESVGLEPYDPRLLPMAGGR